MEERKVRDALLGLVGLSVIGLADSVYLTWHRIALLTGKLKGGSFCSISDQMDCDRVALSAFGELLGIPVGGWGAAFYIFTAVVAVLALHSRNERRQFWLSVLAWSIVGGAIYSGFLAAVSFAFIRSFCLMCGILYIVIATMGLVVFWIARRTGGGLSRVFGGLREFSRFPIRERVGVIVWIGILLVSVGLTYGVIHAYQTNQIRPFLAAEVEEWFDREPKVQIEFSSSLKFGAAEPIVTFFVFSDFECPFCRRVDQLISPILAKNQSEIAIRFFNYPLDNECNPSVSRPMHPNSCKLARAAICLSKQAPLPGVLQALFQNSSESRTDDFYRIARRLGAPQDAFERCYFSAESKDVLDHQIAEANRLGVSATPTLYMDGRRLPPIQSAELFQAFVDYGLKVARHGSKP